MIEFDCPKCKKTVKVEKEPYSPTRMPNSIFFGYFCPDCGHDFEDCGGYHRW